MLLLVGVCWEATLCITFKRRIILYETYHLAKAAELIIHMKHSVSFIIDYTDSKCYHLMMRHHIEYFSFKHI